MLSISFRKHRDDKKENNFDYQNSILVALAITTLTARASSVSPSSYTNNDF